MSNEFRRNWIIYEKKELCKKILKRYQLSFRRVYWKNCNALADMRAKLEILEIYKIYKKYIYKIYKK